MLLIPQIKKTAFRGLLAKHRQDENGTFFPRENQIGYEFENSDYSVTINGQECPVRACRVSAIPFNRTWPGKQRDLSQTELASFITFNADEPVTLTVKVKDAFSRAVLRPLDKNVMLECVADEITFTLTELGNYVLEPFGEHKVLHIFFNPVKVYPDAEKATYYFGPGMHFPGCINLRDNDSVYIDREAIVFGSLYSEGCKNVRIFGGGIFDNSNEERIVEHCYENYTKGTFRLYHSQNITVEDVIFTNSSTWIMSLFYCENIMIDNVKLVGHWRYNTDGIDIVNSRNVTVKNSFIGAFDDVISIKGIYGYTGCIEELTIDNCVLWCGWGHTCEIGIETEAAEFRNITFKNSHCIHNQGPALAIPNKSNSYVHDIKFENMSTEFQRDTLEMVYQRTEDMDFEKLKKPNNNCFVLLKNNQFDETETLKHSNEEYKSMGNIENISFNNVRVYVYDENIKPVINIFNYNECCEFKNIIFDGLYLNGNKQHDFSLFDVNLINVNDISLK